MSITADDVEPGERMYRALKARGKSDDFILGWLRSSINAICHTNKPAELVEELIKAAENVE